MEKKKSQYIILEKDKIPEEFDFDAVGGLPKLAEECFKWTDGDRIYWKVDFLPNGEWELRSWNKERYNEMRFIDKVRFNGIKSVIPVFKSK